MSNTINKKPCKNTTQAGTNHKILLNSFFLYKKPNIYYFFFTKNTFSLSFYFPTYTILKYDKNTRIRVLYNTRIFFCTSIVDNTRIRVLLSPSSNDPFFISTIGNKTVIKLQETMLQNSKSFRRPMIQNTK